MQNVPRDEFLRLAAAWGLEPDLRYSFPNDLVYTHGLQRQPATYAFPTGLPCRQFFEACLFAAAGEESVLLWSRAGDWRALDDQDFDLSPGTPIHGLQSIATTGAVHAMPEEYGAVVDILLEVAGNGWNTNHDVYIAAGDGSALLFMDHHRVVLIFSRTAEIMARIASIMSSQGFVPTNEKPDWTFK